MPLAVGPLPARRRGVRAQYVIKRLSTPAQVTDNREFEVTMN
jgi:hypothetical protein